MKLAILFLPVSLFGAITGVSVVGTTPTQSILAYTAPSSGVCTVAVSLSPSYTPLVPDVDPTLFSGSNSDARAGSITIGLARIFVVGTRTAQAASGTNYSRALQASTTYYYQISCGSDTATGTFTTQTIPTGVGYGEPVPSDPGGSGNYVYPTFSTTDRTSSATDPHTGALVKNLSLINDVVGGGAAQMTDSGMGVMCHPTPVLASNEAKYGYHCAVNIGIFEALYWIASDGEARFLGRLGVPYNGGNWNGQACGGTNAPPFDATDPNTYYCTISTAEARAGHTTIVKGVYSGHSVSGEDADSTGQTGILPHVAYTEIMGYDSGSGTERTLDVLEPEFDPTWTTMGACCTSYSGSTWFNGKLLIYYYNGQNYPAWFFVYDPKQTAAMQTSQFGSASGCINNSAVTGVMFSGVAGCITASTNTAWGPAGSGLRWMSLHALDVLPGDSLVAMMNNPLGQSGDFYRVTLPSGVASTGSSCTMTQPGGNTLPNWPDSSYGFGCSTFTVTGDPALSTARTGYPSTFTAAVGDTLTTISSSGGGPSIGSERMRLLDKGSDGKTWYVQRTWFCPTCGSDLHTAVSPGGTLDMLSSIYGEELWWNPVTGVTYSDTLGGNHAAHITTSLGSWDTVAQEGTQGGGEPARLINPSLYPVLSLGWPTWNGISTAYAYEDHPSLSVSAPPNLATFNQVIDNHPYFGDTSLATSSTVTLVSGQLYRIRGTNVAANYKLIPYFANSGNRAMREVSGPSVTLATDSSTQFQWCVSLNAGECYSASQAGDIYFNAPSVAIAYCNNNWSVLQSTDTVANDICVSAAFSFSQGIRMQSVKQDPLGLTFRVISNSLGKYDTDSNFWNSRTLPDGSWMFTSLQATGNVSLIRVPPLPSATSGATAYLPQAITVPTVAGAHDAYIEFGYAENGAPGSFYCTARQEGCVAQTATIQSTPFYFATTEAGSITGLACASGCAIAVPAVPNRLVYYDAILRNSGGSTVYESIGVAGGSTPAPPAPTLTPALSFSQISGSQY